MKVTKEQDNPHFNLIDSIQAIDDYISRHNQPPYINLNVVKHWYRIRFLLEQKGLIR